VGLYGPKVVWMVNSFYSPGFWDKEHADVDCTREQMRQVVDGILITGNIGFTDDTDKVGISGEWNKVLILTHSDVCRVYKYNTQI